MYSISRAEVIFLEGVASRIHVHPFFWRTQTSTFDDFDAWQSHCAQLCVDGEDIRGLSMFFLIVVCILCVFNPYIIYDCI